MALENFKGTFLEKALIEKLKEDYTHLVEESYTLWDELLYKVVTFLIENNVKYFYDKEYNSLQIYYKSEHKYTSSSLVFIESRNWTTRPESSLCHNYGCFCYREVEVNVISVEERKNLQNIFSLFEETFKKEIEKGIDLKKTKDKLEERYKEVTGRKTVNFEELFLHDYLKDTRIKLPRFLIGEKLGSDTVYSYDFMNSEFPIVLRINSYSNKKRYINKEKFIELWNYYK